MAVFTEVSAEQAQALLRTLQLGQLISLQACSGGIENTNYFVAAERAGQIHHYVLTLFERLTFEQLPFYLALMQHLAQRGVLVPAPHANAQGELVLALQGKPAALVDRLPGQNVHLPTPVHCAQVGATLASLHLAGSDFAGVQSHLRGLSWCNETVPAVLAFLPPAQAQLMQAELAYQNELATTRSYAALPRGPIHADLFRDNVMFETLDGEPVLSGFFDFYFAGIDSWLFDLAVSLNDWCIDFATGTHDAQLAHAFIAAYNDVRPLQAPERALLPAMLRAAALRFWLSRLWDFYLPRQARVLQAHDPDHFERVLRQRLSQALSFEALVQRP